MPINCIPIYRKLKSLLLYNYKSTRNSPFAVDEIRMAHVTSNRCVYLFYGVLLMSYRVYKYIHETESYWFFVALRYPLIKHIFLDLKCSSYPLFVSNTIYNPKLNELSETIWYSSVFNETPLLWYTVYLMIIPTNI